VPEARRWHKITLPYGGRWKGYTYLVPLSYACTACFFFDFEVVVVMVA
jgi:hypothetical protein